MDLGGKKRKPSGEKRREEIRGREEITHKKKGNKTKKESRDVTETAPAFTLKSQQTITNLRGFSTQGAVESAR
jgi:hypothetical protein